MQALYQDSYGGIETYHVGLVPVPTPGPCQALVKIHAASLNMLDIQRGSGELHGMRDQFPLIPGYDFAGVIVEVGGDYSGLKVGDKVWGDVMRCQKARKQGFLGTVCEYCVVDCDLLGKMPEGLTFVEAAALPMVCMLAIETFRNVGLEKSDKLVMTNGGDEFGVHAMQIAKAVYGVGKIGTTVWNSEDVEFAKKYGADRVVDCEKGEDPAKVFENWADVVVDVSSEMDLERKMLKDKGRHISVVKCGQDSFKGWELCPNRKLLDTLKEVMEDKKVKPVIDKVFSLKDGIKAIQHVKEGHPMGKVVVQCVD